MNAGDLINLDDASFFEVGGLKYRFGDCALEKLVPSSHNVRVHPKSQIKKLKRSIQHCLGSPPIVDENLQLLAGHARQIVAFELGMKSIPVLQVVGLSEARKRAFALADNRIPLDAGWDREKLSAALPELTALFEQDGLVLEDTGFEIAEFDQLGTDFAEPIDGEETADLSALDRPPTNQTGDSWTLGGKSGLLVGDARNPENFKLLLKDARADASFLDAPFNIASASIGGRGRARHGNFAVGSGELTPSEFVAFLSSIHANVARYCREGAVVYSCVDWRQVDRLMAVCRPIFGDPLNMAVWCKTNAGQGSFYRSQHELITIWKNGDVPHLNTVQLGRFGRSRTNVWTYPGANTFRKGRLDDLKAHPTIKNTAMVADAIKDCTRPGDLVLDCFGGSGTTLLAAERSGRHAALMEIDGRYADVIIERWQAFTGRDATHQQSGLTFSELRQARLANETPPPRARTRTRARQPYAEQSQ